MNQVANLEISPLMTNTAFVLRLTWDNATQSWRIVVKLANGGAQRVFVDLESAFFYVEQLCTG